VLLGIRAAGDPENLQALDHDACFPGSNHSSYCSYLKVALFISFCSSLFLDILESCPPEETFLRRLLKAGSVEKNAENGTIYHIQEALASRHSSTMNLMKQLEETIAAQRAKTDGLAMASRGKLSSEGLKNLK